MIFMQRARESAYTREQEKTESRTTQTKQDEKETKRRRETVGQAETLCIVKVCILCGSETDRHRYYQIKGNPADHDPMRRNETENYLTFFLF